MQISQEVEDTYIYLCVAASNERRWECEATYIDHCIQRIQYLSYQLLTQTNVCTELERNACRCHPRGVHHFLNPTLITFQVPPMPSEMEGLAMNYPGSNY